MKKESSATKNATYVVLLEECGTVFICETPSVRQGGSTPSRLPFGACPPNATAKLWPASSTRLSAVPPMRRRCGQRFWLGGAEAIPSWLPRGMAWKSLCHRQANCEGQPFTAPAAPGNKRGPDSKLLDRSSKHYAVETLMAGLHRLNQTTTHLPRRHLRREPPRPPRRATAFLQAISHGTAAVCCSQRWPGSLRMTSSSSCRMPVNVPGMTLCRLQTELATHRGLAPRL